MIKKTKRGKNSTTPSSRKGKTDRKIYRGGQLRRSPVLRESDLNLVKG